MMAAFNGHVSVLERLIEAKAAVDGKRFEGRGLGRGLGGKTLLRQWDRCEEVDGMLMQFKFFKF